MSDQRCNNNYVVWTVEMPKQAVAGLKEALWRCLNARWEALAVGSRAGTGELSLSKEKMESLRKFTNVVETLKQCDSSFQDLWDRARKSLSSADAAEIQARVMQALASVATRMTASAAEEALRLLETSPALTGAAEKEAETIIAGLVPQYLATLADVDLSEHTVIREQKTYLEFVAKLCKMYGRSDQVPSYIAYHLSVLDAMQCVEKGDESCIDNLITALQAIDGTVLEGSEDEPQKPAFDLVFEASVKQARQSLAELGKEKLQQKFEAMSAMAEEPANITWHEAGQPPPPRTDCLQ